MKIDIVKKILEDHSTIKSGKLSYEFDEHLELIVQQDKNKITLYGFNHKTSRYLNLSAKKYSKLIEGFKSISSSSYFDGEYFYVVLDLDLLETKPARFIGYCRVSTKGQLDGNGLQAQEQEILIKYPNAEIVHEQFTGSKLGRPVFNNIFQNLNHNDTLIVTKLDRLARNTVEGIQIIESLFTKGVAVHVLNVGLLEDTTMGKFFLTTLLAVAEMERNIIIERTQAGKEVAKQNPNFKDGRPKKFSNKQIEHALKLLETNSYKEVEQLTGISKSTLIRSKNKLK